MKMTLKRMVALVLAVLLVACFHFTALGEEAAALPVNVRIITLNLGTTEFYYDGLILKANVENGSGAGARWQICQAYVDGGSNAWADYEYAETVTVTVVPGIENWAIRCILPTGEMSQDFRVTKDFTYRPVEEPAVVEEVTEAPAEVEAPVEEPAAVEEAHVAVEEPAVVEAPVEAPVEEAAPVEVPAVEETPAEVEVPAVEETPETTEEEIEIVVAEEEDDDEVFFDDDELVEFDDDDWGTTDGNDFSELDNLANGITDDAAEADTEEDNEENEEEKEEVIEEAETETPAVEAEEITEVVVAEEENTEEYEEVIEDTETETPAVEGEKIAEEEQTEVENAEDEDFIEMTVETAAETLAVEVEKITEEQNDFINEMLVAIDSERVGIPVDYAAYWEGEQLYFGDLGTLIAKNNIALGNVEYEILWQFSKDGVEWQDAGYGSEISVIVTEENYLDEWRAFMMIK